MRDFHTVGGGWGRQARASEILVLLFWTLWLAGSGFGLIYGYFVGFGWGRACLGHVEQSENINPVQAGRICTYFVPYAAVLLFWIVSAAGFWGVARR